MENKQTSWPYLSFSSWGFMALVGKLFKEIQGAVAAAAAALAAASAASADSPGNMTQQQQ